MVIMNMLKKTRVNYIHRDTRDGHSYKLHSTNASACFGARITMHNYSCWRWKVIGCHIADNHTLISGDRFAEEHTILVSYSAVLYIGIMEIMDF